MSHQANSDDGSLGLMRNASRHFARMVGLTRMTDRGNLLGRGSRMQGGRLSESDLLDLTRGGNGRPPFATITKKPEGVSCSVFTSVRRLICNLT
jgi:hypothetical protein